MRSPIQGVTILSPGMEYTCTALSQNTALPTTRDGKAPKLVMVEVVTGAPAFLFGFNGGVIIINTGIRLSNNGTSVGVFNVSGMTHVLYIDAAATGVFRIHALEDQ